MAVLAIFSAWGEKRSKRLMRYSHGRSHSASRVGLLVFDGLGDFGVVGGDAMRDRHQTRKRGGDGIPVGQETRRAGADRADQIVPLVGGDDRTGACRKKPTKAAST